MNEQEGSAPDQTEDMAEQGMEGQGVDKASRGGQQEAPGGMTPEQTDVLKRVSVLAQTALADDQSGKQIVDEASRGDQGLVSASIGLLQMILEKMDIDVDMVIPAAVAVMAIIYKFLIDIGRAKDDPNKFGDLTGKLAAMVAQQFKLPDDMVREQMVGSEGGQQQAPDRSAMGAIGQMMGGA